MATELFQRMALSFAGCDGGNLNSDIWFCGMEWGGSSEDNNLVLEPAANLSWNHNDFRGSQKTQLNQKLCWFLKYYYDLPEPLPFNQETADKYKIMENVPDGMGFKMNMLPINFKNRASVTWPAEFVRDTGFESFSDYREWCVTHRGRYFQSLRAKHQPELILCLGKQEQSNFLRFFGANPDSATSISNFTYSKEGGTYIFVVPFFGRPINSKVLMAKLVDEIRAVIRTSVCV